jgi:hypothetical protein
MARQYKTGLVQWAEAQGRKFEAATGPSSEQTAVACMPTKPGITLASAD